MVKRRKIPVRKHHGVRDPLKQLEEKAKKLKNIINNPPDSENDQKLSYKFRQFKELADKAENGKKIKRIRKGIEDKPKVKPALVTGKSKQQDVIIENNKFKQIPQIPGESDRAYLARVNRITQDSLKEAQFEIKYGVKVIRNAKTGEIYIQKKAANELDELLKENRRLKKGNRRNKKSAKEIGLMDPKMAKDLVKQVIRESKEERKLEKNKNLNEYKMDNIKFGEVVHAPPVFSTLPRKATICETVPRPGKKSNLLLKDLLSESTTQMNKSASKTKLNKVDRIKQITKSQLKGKRKDLPQATRYMLENESKKFIDLYRQLKKKE